MYPNIYAKNSMDRFGDDLCQLLLSYLSLEDRFRCECVSKQFQRTIFESVVDITLNGRFIYRLFNEKTIDIKMLATIAIKCPKIQTIDCREIHSFIAYIPEVLNTFRDNCRHLREIYCNLWANSLQEMNTLWPLMTRIVDMNTNASESQSLSHCHRLSELKVFYLDQVFDSTYGQLLAKNLHKFELYFYSADDYHRLSAFVAHNQSLRSIVAMNRYNTDDTLHEMCGQLSRLTQLRELTLGVKLTTDQHLLADSLRTIAVNCKQLKRLSLNCYSEVNEPDLKSLDSLGYYRRLKRLGLTLDVTVREISLDSLRDCKRLTHLDMFSVGIAAKVLQSVVNNCPRLQYLSIHDLYSIIDTECLSHISRLPALQMLSRPMYSDMINGLDSYSPYNQISTGYKLGIT
ncbi:unnamed protein product [Medioppia subpectinata]|uniref:F-box domain-containing protein n=1 Tax=Medioppia subpectinata TaxID=1979941 RepID=A0A7R9KP78_9ACAR|nr:unnamed protein product [Medioppia subpectinata]CAG2106908.1 unnamed protein product [Medioppia subpectinata]